MPSDLAAALDREQSLEAMWHALHASKSARRNYVEINAGVVHALLNARYYSSDRGQFISEDPSFLAVGDPNAIKQVTGQDQRTFLGDPQLTNSYNYGRDNPLTNKDPNGNASALAAIAPFVPEIEVGGAVITPYVTVPLILGTSIFAGAEIMMRTSNGIKYGGQFDWRRRGVPPSMLGPQNIGDPFGGGVP